MASVANTRPKDVPSASLWFGFAASAGAWAALGAGDVLITWWACVENQPLGAGSVRSGAGILYFVAAILLMGNGGCSGHHVVPQLEKTFERR